MLLWLVGFPLTVLVGAILWWLWNEHIRTNTPQYQPLRSSPPSHPQAQQPQGNFGHRPTAVPLPNTSQPSQGPTPFPRLSSPISQIRSFYTVVVVGSGYGGSVAASRLARTGQRVCLLERGKELHPGEYPSTTTQVLENIQFDTPLKRVGKPTALFDFRSNNDMWVMTGCGLGGTSLVNASVSVRPDSRVFQYFPPEVPGPLLEESFNAAIAMLQPAPLPDSIQLSKTTTMQQMTKRMGGSFVRVPLNVNFGPQRKTPGGLVLDQCNLCGNCVTGCNVGAKSTTLMNYLPDAKNHGAEMYCQVSVQHVQRLTPWAEKDDPNTANWKVNCIYHGDDGKSTPFAVLCGICILSAGSVGTAEIMLRSKYMGLSCSSMTGLRFSANGDCLGFAYNGDLAVNGIGVNDPKGVEPVGPTITSACDLRNPAQPLKDGFYIEEGAIPVGLASMLPEVMAAASAATGKRTPGANLLEQAKREAESLLKGPYYGAVHNTQTFLCNGHDDADGYYYLKDDRLRINWPNAGKESAFVKAQEHMFNATCATNGTFIKDPLYNRLDDYSLITVHPLGGCAMTTNGQDGVVNHKGQVFTSSIPFNTPVWSSLYIIDGAVLPQALGANPLLTITALAERSVYLLAQDNGWKFERTLLAPLAPNAAAQSSQVRDIEDFEQ